MPIQFPRPTGFDRLFERQWLLELKAKYFRATPAPNLGRVGVPFNTKSFDPGIGVSAVQAVNVRRLGTMYTAPTDTAIVNPAAKLIERTDYTASYNRVGGELRMSITGVSRNATGNPLGGCLILVFDYANRRLVAETYSDGSGNWSVELPAPVGNVFFYEYKPGGPDLFGASPPTNTPTVI